MLVLTKAFREELITGILLYLIDCMIVEETSTMSICSTFREALMDTDSDPESMGVDPDPGNSETDSEM